MTRTRPWLWCLQIVWRLPSRELVKKGGIRLFLRRDPFLVVLEDMVERLSEIPIDIGFGHLVTLCKVLARVNSDLRVSSSHTEQEAGYSESVGTCRGVVLR